MAVRMFYLKVSPTACVLSLRVVLPIILVTASIKVTKNSSSNNNNYYYDKNYSVNLCAWEHTNKAK